MNRYEYENSVPFKFQPKDANNDILPYGDYEDGDALDGSKSNLQVTVTVIDLTTGEPATTSDGTVIDSLDMKLNSTVSTNPYAYSNVANLGFNPESDNSYKVTYWYVSTLNDNADGVQISYSEQFLVKKSENVDLTPPE